MTPIGEKKITMDVGNNPMVINPMVKDIRRRVIMMEILILVPGAL